ncbi:MAG TPA: DinB family protein [Pyrinomonadaceae bacterium]|nr:DinB family protein [Pyrinomonadaceae bacterium]
MNDEILDLISQLEIISDDTKLTFGKFSLAQINWKPNAESWSVGQCFEHLIVTNNLYFPNIQKVINGTHRNNFFSKIPFSTNFIALMMKNALNPEQKRKMKTFKVFEPSVSNVSPKIIEDFVENNQKLIEMIEVCKDLDLHKIKIAEPLSVALNLRLDDAFEILVMHEKRHFKQAERVSHSGGFPR